MDIVIKPLVREADDARKIPALVTNFGVRGVWQPQFEALLHIRVIDNDARSYHQRAVYALLATAEREKRKCSNATQEPHASFPPMVLSVSGCLFRHQRLSVCDQRN